jgi:hypothetical protein
LLCLVIRDNLVEYEVYEGLAPIILFFTHEHVTGRCYVLTVWRWLWIIGIEELD